MKEDVKLFFAIGALVGSFVAIGFTYDYLSMRNKAECRALMAQKSAAEIIAICGPLK